jgi:membrane protease YdiL (CAAX protease family)
MTDDQPLPAAPELLPPSQPDPYPFWSYSDLGLFIGLALVYMLAGPTLVKVAMLAFHWHATTKLAELLPAQLLMYVLLFGSLALIFRLRYDRPFWRSLGWNPIRLPLPLVIGSGVGTLFAVMLLAVLIRVPNESNPMTELLQNRMSILLIGIFGVTLGPLSEELAFRGFLQPLLVRSLGAVPGVLLAALVFGLLHFQEYGNSWKHVVMISAAGIGFGWMRQATGSTKAATLMHATYNGVQFVALLALGGKGVPHS